MKKSLLTLSLLVSFAPVVFAAGKKTVKPAVKVIAEVKNTEADTTDESTDSEGTNDEEAPAEDVVAPWYSRGYDWTKNHVSNNKKYYIGGTSALAFGGLGYAGYQNPRTVRRFSKVGRRFGRLALKAALANPWRTAVVVGLPAFALGLYNKDAVSTRWTKFSTGCSDKWANRSSWLGGPAAVIVDEDNKDETNNEETVEKTDEVVNSTK